MTRISRGTLTNASGAIFAPMCFDSNTDIWKHTSHFVRRPSSLLFEIIGSVDYLEMSERRRARRKFLLQESPTSHIATFHEASSLEAGRSFLKWMYEKVEEWPVNEFQNCEGLQRRPSDTYWPISLTHGSWRPAKSKKRPKSSENLTKSKKWKRFRK